jgi:hypothetical protein
MRIIKAIFSIIVIALIGCEGSVDSSKNSIETIDSSKFVFQPVESHESKVEPLSFKGMLPDKYELKARSRISGDFNNNGSMDTSVVIRNRDTDDLGIAILDGETRSIELFGAGDTSFGMHNWNFVDEFRMISRGQNIDFTGELGVETDEWILPSDGIYMHIDEACGGGLLFWKNNKYEFVGFD